MVMIVGHITYHTYHQRYAIWVCVLPVVWQFDWRKWWLNHQMKQGFCARSPGNGWKLLELAWTSHGDLVCWEHHRSGENLHLLCLISGVWDFDQRNTSRCPAAPKKHPVISCRHVRRKTCDVSKPYPSSPSYQTHMFTHYDMCEPLPGPYPLLRGSK